MVSLPRGVVLTNDIKRNGRKKLLIIGKTGTGKSSLCNVITGNAHDAKIFPVSSAANSCTQRTQFADVNFNNNREIPISLIDTIGFDDPDKNDDANIIAELVDKLNNACDHVNLFVIAVNGQNPRLDGSLIGIIKIFEGMFTEQFWKQVVIVFTRIPMDKKSLKKREKNNNQTDDELAKNYLLEVEKRFKMGKNLKYLYLDACYDEEDAEERAALDTSLEQLYKELDNGPNLETLQVKKVETASAALKRQIAEKEKERMEAEKDFMKEMKRLKDDLKLSQEQREEEVRKLREQQEEKGFCTKDWVKAIGIIAETVVEAIAGIFVPNQNDLLGRGGCFLSNGVQRSLNPVGSPLPGLVLPKPK